MAAAGSHTCAFARTSCGSVSEWTVMLDIFPASVGTEVIDGWLDVPALNAVGSIKNPLPKAFKQASFRVQQR